MKIAVLGAGPIGATLAGFLAIGGADVWMVDHHTNVIEAVQKRGVTIYASMSFGKDAQVLKFNTPVHVVPKPEDIGVSDVVIVAIKGNGTRAAIPDIRKMVDAHTMILSAQNGLGSADILEREFPGQIAYGVLVLAAHRVEDEAGAYAVTLYPQTKHFRVTTEHEPLIPALKALENYVKDTPYHLVYTDKEKCDRELWKKLLLNIVVNPINAIHEGPMDALFSLPQGIELANLVVNEALEVAHAKGIDLTREQVKLVPTTVQPKIAADGVRHYSSMCMDVVHRRPVEDEMLSGAIVREGEKLGIPTPYNRTLSLLMQIIENTYEDRYSATH